jgi:hypothetical protein
MQIPHSHLLGAALLLFPTQHHRELVVACRSGLHTGCPLHSLAPYYFLDIWDLPLSLGPLPAPGGQIRPPADLPG